MTYINSNLSNSEAFRMYNTLNPERIESLLEYEKNAEYIQGAQSSIDEAKGSFYNEDDLTDVIESLYSLEKQLRGDNKIRLTEIIEQLEQANTGMINNADYGRECLESAEKSLNGEI